MTLENKAWQDLETAYLDRVEKALSSVKHPHIAEVLEDVRSHLDQRFMALGPDEQTRHDFEAIIEQMGPASDYTELLSQNSAASPPRVLRKHMLLAGLAIAIMAVALLLPVALWGQPRRIVSTTPSITEMLFALGLGDRVTGVTTYCRYPEQARRLPKIGTLMMNMSKPIRP